MRGDERFDNLIAAGTMPPVIALFVEPGETGSGLPIYGGTGNRSVEYDSIGPAYASFLIDELIPEMTQGCRLPPMRPRVRSAGSHRVGSARSTRRSSVPTTSARS